MRALPWALLFSGLAFSVGCVGVRPEVKAALTGSLPELQQEIARADSRGELSGARLQQLAHAVAEREIAGARGADGAAQLAVFRPCLPELETALDERAARGALGAGPAGSGLVDLSAGGGDQGHLGGLGAGWEAAGFRQGGGRELARMLSRSGLVPVSAATLLLGSRDARAAAVSVLARAI